MTRTILRLLAVVGAATATLAFAANALATPKLIISGTTVQVTEDKSDAAPLKITIYMPSGYSAALAQTAGAQIGTVHADLQALAISPDAIIQADGTVLAGDPSSSALQSSGTQCTGTPTHAAIWLLHVTVSGTTLDVPVYLDPTSGTETALGIAKLVLCLPNPYEQAAPGTRAAFGVKIINAKMTLNAGVITPPTTAGTYLWRSTITPWTANGATPHAAGTIEAQSIVTLPAVTTLKASVKSIKHKKGKKITYTNSVTLTGTVTENGSPVAGATVNIFSGAKKVATVTTGASGTFSKKLGLGKKTSYKATVTVADRSASCISALPATQVPGGCASATQPGWTATTNSVSAKPKTPVR